MNTDNGYKKTESGIFLPYAKKVEKGKVNPKIVNIVKGFKDQSRKDIQKWRQAIKMAMLPENPNFQMYHDLVDDLLTDGHLQSQIGIRLSATLNTDFHVINRKTGKENEELTHTLRQQWFFELLEQYLTHIIRGFKLLEFQEFNNEKIKVFEIPQRHLIPTLGRIIPDLSNADTFIDFTDEQLKPWLLSFGKPEYLGIINNIIPSIIWKRNVTQSWAEFCERFGIPLITATTNTRDKKGLNDVHDMLIGIGEASVGTFPMGTDIKFHEANRTDVFKVYSEFIQLNTNDISKQLVGSTMLSDQGTNRSQTEVHERSLDNKIASSDKRSAMFMVNDQLFPLLQLQGYKISEDDYFEFKTAEQEIELTQLWNITNGLISNGYDVETEWISKTFNIPIGEKKKLKPSTEITASFKNRYPVSCSHNHPTANIDNISKRLTDLTKSLAIASLSEHEVRGIIGTIIAEEASAFVNDMFSSFDSDDVYTGPDKLVMQMMEYNCYDFAVSKTQARHYAVSNLLIDYKEGRLKTESEFIQACLKENENLNTHYLRTERNLAITTGQNSAAYIRFLKDAKEGGVKYYEYQTMGDDKVRSSHASLDGKVFNILQPAEKNIWPPNGFGCRCEMVPWSGDTRNLTGWKEAERKLTIADPNFKKFNFNQNRAELKKIFLDENFYTVYPTESEDGDVVFDKKAINETNYKHYGLKPWDEFKNKLKNYKPTTKNIANQFRVDGQVKNRDYMGFKDYMGRKLILTENKFKSHTSGDYLTPAKGNRHLIFHLIEDALKNPDEVWTKKYGRNKSQRHQTNYVKFYKNIRLCVNTTVSEDMEAQEINTWFPVMSNSGHTDTEAEEDIRKGILIKKK